MLTRDNMFSAVMTARSELRKTPTIVEYDSIAKKKNLPTSKTIIRAYGRWNIAMREFGLAPNHNDQRWRELV